MNKINNSILMWYMDRELELFPLRGASKVPLEAGWQEKVYTYNELYVHASKGGNIGWRLGPCDVVFDIDPRQSGDVSLDRLKKDIGLDLDDTTCMIKTGGGGYHYYYNKPDILKIRALPEYPGIDIKRLGGYVVIAGSAHESGNFYSFYNDLELNPIPPQLAAYYGRATHEHSLQGYDDVLTPGELETILMSLDPCDYNTNDTWFPILAASCNATQGDEEAREIFVEWSMLDENFAGNEATIRNRWDSVAATAQYQENGVRHIGTLVHELKKNGVDTRWISNRGRPDFKVEALETIEDIYTAMSFIPDDASDRELMPIVTAMDDLGCDEHVYNEFEKIVGRSASTIYRATDLLAINSDAPNQPSLDFGQMVALAVLRDYFNRGKMLVRGEDETFWKFYKTHWEKIPKDVLRQQILLTADREKGFKTISPTLSEVIVRQSYNLLQAYSAEHESIFLKHSDTMSCINTLSCEVWLEQATGKIETKEHTPSSYLTHVLPIEYHPEDKCPIFDRALHQIFENEDDPDDMVRHLWEIFGYVMQPKKNIASWFLFHGKGANGKTFVLRILAAILGKAVCGKAVDSFNIRANKHAYFDLVGKLALIDEDVKSHIFLPDDFLKHFSESKTLSATEHYKAAKEYQMNVTCLMAANNWPSSKDLSHGMLRRAFILPFSRIFKTSEMDIDLYDKVVKLELSGVLNRAIEGLQRLRKRGTFLEPKPCIMAKDEWLKNANQAAEFLNECFVEEKGRSVKFKDVFSTYNNWKSMQGVHVGYSLKDLRAALENMGVTIERGGGNYVTMKGYRRQDIDNVL